MDYPAHRIGQRQLQQLNEERMNYLFSPRFAQNSGIAIGIILFIIAVLAVLSIALTSTGNFMSTTVTPDRVSADLRSQANLIRSKILECYTYGYERGDLSDKYPSSSGNGTAVNSLTCPSYTSGVNNIWSGQSPASLPPPPTGFDVWYYVNAGATGGRCIRIQPLAANVADVGFKNGLSQAAGYFDGNEYVYDGNSASQRFILWITRPSGSASANCSS